MSLPLADQKLGSHSNQDSTSHKFMLKGRQSGGMHKSHAWVFRAESYDTMMAWFGDIKSLTETTGPARDAFIRRNHARSISGGSHNAGSISEGSALDEDEADQVPYSASASQVEPSAEKLPQRPNPGGRFPSLLSVNRDSQVPLSPSSTSENSGDREIVAAVGALPGSGVHSGGLGKQVGDDGESDEMRGTLAAPLNKDVYSDSQTKPKYNEPPKQEVEDPASASVQAQGVSSDGPSSAAYAQHPVPERHDSTYGTWMAPTAAGGNGAPAGAADIEAYKQQAQREKRQEEQPGLQAVEMAPPPATKEDMTMSALAAAQLSTFDIKNANKGAVGGITTVSTDAVSPNIPAAQAADSAAPSKDLANRPPLESQTSAMSVSQLHVPGKFPPSRTNTEPL